MILIISSVHDPHARRVAQELQNRGESVRLLDFADFGAGSLVRFDPKRPEATVVAVPGEPDLVLGDVSCVWLRRPARPALPPAMSAEDDRLLARREWQDLTTGMLLSMDARFVNSPVAQARAVKPWQLVVAARVGLDIPPTLISNAPAAVETFARENSPIIHKTLTSPTTRFLATERWTPQLEELLPLLPLAPSIFQSEVRGQDDVRVTIVGDEMFAVEFDSDRELVDSRLDVDSRCREHSLLPEMRERLRALMRALGLDYATVDLKCRDGQYTFLELNPQGQFLYLEIRTGLPIANAVAALLSDPLRAAVPSL